jgi:tetratricopeptide (TPR) repeat protein
MTGKLFLASTALTLFPLQVFAQSDQRIQRKDSITVSAGIPKEQLALEDQLNGILSQGDQLLKAGNAADAIKEYQLAVELVKKEPLLAGKDYWVHKKLADGYMRSKQPNDAIPIYEKLLDARERDCQPDAPTQLACADAQLDLGKADMQAGNFPDATPLLQAADSRYTKAEKLSVDSHEFAMIQVKNQGQTKLLIAVALYKTGKTPEALATVETAISELTRVQSDETIQVFIRDDAARSLQQAQTMITHLKSTP